MAVFVNGSQLMSFHLILSVQPAPQQEMMQMVTWTDKHIVKVWAHETSSWQWINESGGTIETMLLTTCTALNRCSRGVRKPNNKKNKSSGLVLPARVLFAPRLSPTWRLRQRITTHKKASSGWNGRLKSNLISLPHLLQPGSPPDVSCLAFDWFTRQEAKSLHTCLSYNPSAGARPLGPIKCVYLRPRSDSNLATRPKNPDDIICQCERNVLVFFTLNSSNRGPRALLLCNIMQSLSLLW